MADYISREAAVKIAQEYGFVRGNFEFGHTLHSAAADCIAIEIEGLPAADVEPVRHGRWVRTEDDWNSLTTFQCTVCGEEFCFEIDEDLELLNYNYCPNCGAKMDLEDENDG